MTRLGQFADAAELELELEPESELELELELDDAGGGPTSEAVGHRYS